MGNLFKIAFRNIFRNFRRSVLTIIMILIAVQIIVQGNSFLSGMLTNIANESVLITGHVQVTSKDHDLKEKMMSLAGNVSNYSNIKNSLSGVKDIETVLGQLKFSTVIYKGEKNKQGYGYGIEQSAVKKLNLSDYIYKGRIIKKSNNEIMVGREIAKKLKLQIGENVTLWVRTLDNKNNIVSYKVVGFFDSGNTLLNKTFYIPLPVAQKLLNMTDRVTEILLFGKSVNKTSEIIDHIKGLGPLKGLKFKRWNQIGMGPLLIGIVGIISTVVQLVIISLAAFGIANTIMMAVLERKGEIGLMKSMGMHESEIITLFTIEGLLLGLIGVIGGMITGGIVAFVLSTHGINIGNGMKDFSVKLTGVVYGGFSPGIFIKGFSYGMIATVVATIIPVINGVRLKPSEALRK